MNTTYYYDGYYGQAQAEYEDDPVGFDDEPAIEDCRVMYADMRAKAKDWGMAPKDFDRRVEARLPYGRRVTPGTWVLEARKLAEEVERAGRKARRI